MNEPFKDLKTLVRVLKNSSWYGYHCNDNPDEDYNSRDDYDEDRVKCLSNLKPIIEEVEAKHKALNDWLGNNGNEDNEKEFEKGWNCYKENPDANIHKKVINDFTAGFYAAKNYYESRV